MGRTVWFRSFARDNAWAQSVQDGLRKAGLEIVSFADRAAASYGIVGFDAVDDRLLDAIHDLRHNYSRRSFVALASSPSLVEDGGVWRLLHAGASDVVAWDEIGAAGRVADRLDRWRTIDELSDAAVAGESLAGDSRAWFDLLRKVVEAARFSAAPVLLTGESGTGKEILARLIHRVSCRGQPEGQKRDLVTVDCSTLVPELSGSELFGHERGAFTGAHAARDGAFALADGATLFLDEVGELPLPMQAQLLRAVQEKTYKRVGGNIWQATNFRLVCATNRDLGALVRAGQFRLDLFYRIAAWVFRTLPIAERCEDILPLAHHFLHALLPSAGIDAAVCHYLVNRSYTGNIRELRQLIERIANRHVGPGPVTAGDIPEEDRPCDESPQRAWPDDGLERAVANAIGLGIKLRELSVTTTKLAIRIAVRSEDGNLQRAAKRLGVTDRALQMRRAAGMFPD